MANNAGSSMYQNQAGNAGFMANGNGGNGGSSGGDVGFMGAGGGNVPPASPQMSLSTNGNTGGAFVGGDGAGSLLTSAVSAPNTGGGFMGVGGTDAGSVHLISMRPFYS